MEGKGCRQTSPNGKIIPVCKSNTHTISRVQAVKFCSFQINFYFQIQLETSRFVHLPCLIYIDIFNTQFLEGRFLCCTSLAFSQVPFSWPTLKHNYGAYLFILLENTYVVLIKLQQLTVTPESCFIISFNLSHYMNKSSTFIKTD